MVEENEEELITWKCKFCDKFEVKDTKKRTFAKAIDHLSNKHPKEYIDIIWKVAEEMEPIKVPIGFLRSKMQKFKCRGCSCECELKVTDKMITRPIYCVLKYEGRTKPLEVIWEDVG